MTDLISKTDAAHPAGEPEARLFDDWIDPIETGVRERVRAWIEALIQAELETALGRPRYGRKGSHEQPASTHGYRHGSRCRSLTGTFGQTEIAVPRARLHIEDGTTAEWRSGALRAYQRRTKAADALIASAYLAGTNTRRVRRALAALFGGAVGKDTVSRVWRKVQTDWQAWNQRSLAEEPIVRLILDGTVVRVRLDRKATSISLLVVIGIREDGQKVLLAVKNMGRSRTWAERRRPPGGRCSTILSRASCAGQPSSLWMERRAWSRLSRRSGRGFRRSAARCTSTATCSPMRPSASTTRSRLTTPT